MIPQPPDHSPAGKPPALRDDAVAIVRVLRKAGHVAYFAGGCVRDLLLGKAPKDYDVATDAPPPRVRELFRNTQAVGAAFGVILVRLQRSVVEVATFRADGKYVDGRHPDAVRFTTAEEDAQRRDFTINGLFLDPLESDRVLDFVGGRADLSAKLIRAIGDPERRFEEDHLRLLRAVRFAARLGFDIEPATSEAIRRNAPQLKRISPERIAEELRVMLTPLTRPAAWRMLGDLALTAEVFRHLPGVPAGAGNPRAYVGDLFPRVAPTLPIPFGFALATAVVTLERGWQLPSGAFSEPGGLRPVLRALRQGLKISNDEADDVTDTLEGFALVVGDEVKSVAQKKRFLARPFATHSMELLDGYAPLSGHRERIAILLAELRQLKTTDFAPPPLLTGDDLTAAGLQPGPVFKRVLDMVYDAQLEGRVHTRLEALDMGLGIACGRT